MIDFDIKRIGSHLSRSRHQRGWVQETGKRVRRWRGHYYIYVRELDGREIRRHRAIILGLKCEMRKWEAERKLQAIITSTTSTVQARPSGEVTLRWFWQNRYRPMKEPAWKVSSRGRVVQFIQHYILSAFGDRKLNELTRFEIQTYLNKLAGEFSYSVVSKFRVYIRAILDEGLEQDFLERNVARKLTMPATKKPRKRVLTPEEIAGIMTELSPRDKLIVRMFLVLGLRPGELFALRRNDKEPGRLRIDESVSADRLLVEPKSAASASYVWLPQPLETELDFRLECQADKRLEAFMFPTRKGTPLNVSNYLNQALKPAAERARKAGSTPQGFLEGVNHQTFRRTCATYMQKLGTPKDIQAHLRHASAVTTMGVYVQAIPASVRAAVEELDRALSANPVRNETVN